MKALARFPRRPSGFTLLELLIVIAIIAILASVAFPVTALVIRQARKAEARNEVVNLVRAIKAYDMEYSQLPIKKGSAGPDTYNTQTNQEFMEVLLGSDEILNPRGKVFYTGKEAKERAGGLDYGEGGNSGGAKPRLVDPWGNMYFIAIDGNYDHKLQGPSDCGSGNISQDVICWSKGPPKDGDNAEFEDCSKWPKSW